MSRGRTYGACFALALLLVMPSPSWAQAEQRPISDFIAAQSVFPPTYTPWVDPATNQWLMFDAFGTLADRFALDFGTTFDGRVTVRPLADGRAHVTVVLHTKNGICYGFNGAPTAATLAFGERPSVIGVTGAPAALGEAVTRFEFTMPSMDAPLPDYFADLGYEDYPIEFLAAVVNCDGELRAASGYPDGTPGKAHTTQTGLYMTGVPGGCPPEQDASCFPAEIVFFRPVGRK